MNDQSQLTERPPATQWLLLAAALLILGGIIGWNLYAEHHAIEAGERARLAHQAKVIDENLGQQLLAASLALDSIRSDLPYLKAQKESKALLNRRLRGLSDILTGVRTLVILDAEGTVIASNREPLMGRNFAERDYFQLARQRRNPAVLHVSQPFTSGLGVFSVALVKVVLDDHGGFAGLINATLDPDYFSILLDSVRYAPEVWTGLVHADGKVFLMVPAKPGIQGADLARPGSFFARHRDSGQDDSVLTGISLASGEELMMAQRTIWPASLVMDKPLVAAVARDLSSIFAPWRQHAFRQGGLFAAIVLATSLGLAFYQKRTREFGRIAAAHEVEQRRQAEQYRSIIQASLDGFWITDSSARIVDANDAVCRMLGYSREELLALSISDIEADEAPDEIAARTREMAARGHVQFEARHRRKDGRIINVEVSVQYIEALGDQFFAFVRDVTERRRTEALMQASEARYRAVAQSASDAIIVADSAGKIISWNRGAEAMFGHTAAEALLLPLTSVMPERYRERHLGGFARLMSGGEPHTAGTVVELAGLRKDGNEFPIEASLSHWDVAEGRFVTGIIRDITERKKAEQALRQSESRFRKMFERNDSVMLLVDPESARIVDANAAAANFYGYSIERFKNMPIGQINGLSPDEITERLAQVARHERNVFVFPHHLASGEIRTVEVRSCPIELGDRAVLFSIVQDVTEREAATAELERSNADLEQFSYAISHDMRQPLRMISSYMQLLEADLTDQLDAEKREFFGYAIDGAKRLDKMLLGLLDYSRVGRVCEPPTWVESRALLDEALQFMGPMVAETQATLSVSGDWPRVAVSRDEILRLMLNLIGNALKFRVAGRCPEISITSETVGNEWRMSVTDNGVGILPDQIDRLFRVFQRLQSRAVYEGTGIGLALCRKIVEHYGGSIRAESAGQGQGSTFRFEMPWAP